SERVTYDRPKSPRSSPPAQSAYCTGYGRSRPNSARVAAMASGVACTPSATRAGSPGRIAMKANTTTDASTRLRANTKVRLISWSSTVASPSGTADGRQVERFADAVLRQPGDIGSRDDQV